MCVYVDGSADNDASSNGLRQHDARIPWNAPPPDASDAAVLGAAVERVRQQLDVQRRSDAPGRHAATAWDADANKCKDALYLLRILHLENL